MFSRNSKKRKVAKIDSLIDHNTELQGNVSFSGGLHVDGKLKGQCSAHEPSSLPTLSDQGGRLPSIILNGAVIGDVYAKERVELAAKAKVTGNVYIQSH